MLGHGKGKVGGDPNLLEIRGGTKSAVRLWVGTFCVDQ